LWRPSLLTAIADPEGCRYLRQASDSSEFSGGVESWISTIIRTVLKKMSQEEGVRVAYSATGISLIRHRSWDEDRAVRGIVSHRMSNSPIEYEIQFLGYEMPDDSIWRTRDQMPHLTYFDEYDGLVAASAFEDESPMDNDEVNETEDEKAENNETEDNEGQEDVSAAEFTPDSENLSDGE
jgi:hypothetical protein